MKRLLADTLYAQPTSMVISALGGVCTALFSIWLTDDFAIELAAFTVASVALFRLIAVFLVAHLEGRQQRLCKGMFEAGAFVYATAVGLMAALAIVKDLPPDAQVLMIGFAIAYGAGISARNAGNPGLAIGQLFLALAIPVLALLARGDRTGLLLAASMGIMFPAMASVTLYMHRVLRKSVTMAEASARLAEKMKGIARTDVLTGLLNRAGLNIDLAAALASLPPDRKLALFWMDLDKFKEVNDLLGHQIGDRLLAEVAARLRRLAPEGATLARFGGDEFIMACEAESREDLERMAAAMLHSVTSPMRLDGHALEIGGSIGIAVMPDDGSEIDALMQAADVALYHAKAQGKRQASFFSPQMTRQMAWRREIEADLRQALQNDELTVFYQPIIDLQTGRIRSFEALSRWFHPLKGELTPDEFIPVAEETGVIISLGNWLVAKAAQAAADWPEDVSVAVNLSPLHIRAPGAAMAIMAAVRQARLDPGRLVIEITESALLEKSASTDSFIAELDSAGVRFALDDFGTGYSSLASLNAYPFSHIKIDRSFVASASSSRKSDAIIRAVTGMAAALGMDIVAEGIETETQAVAIRDSGCNLGQGWFYSRAVPASLASMLIASNRASERAPRRHIG